MKRIMLGVTGGIAAYKATSLVTGLRKANYQVTVVMTRAATHFITPFTLESLSGKPVYVDLFEPSRQFAVEHIELARRSDLLLIAPCTANVIAKLAHGIADDYLTTMALAVTCPIVICPAMNHNMYMNDAVQSNLRTLVDRGYLVIDPEEGRLASGAYGTGRLPDPDDILRRLASLVPSWEDFLMEDADAPGEVVSGATARLLTGQRVLVTAGPTREFIDPVRFVSNPSSGRMGYEVARAARDAGARVTLVSGPTHLVPPGGITVIPITSAADLACAVFERFDENDIVIKAAAVSDYTPVTRHQQKIKKESSDSRMAVEFERTTDVLKELGARKGQKLLVGFAAESENAVENARRKLVSKNADLIVANDVTEPGAGFEHDTNRVTIVGPGERVESLPLPNKSEVATHLVRRIAELLP